MVLLLGRVAAAAAAAVVAGWAGPHCHDYNGEEDGHCQAELRGLRPKTVSQVKLRIVINLEKLSTILHVFTFCLINLYLSWSKIGMEEAPLCFNFRHTCC